MAAAISQPRFARSGADVSPDALSTASAVPEPSPEWLPMKLGRFELFARASSAKAMFSGLRTKTWSEDERERLRAVIVDCTGRGIVVSIQELTDATEQVQLRFGPDELEEGMECVERVLRSKLNPEEANEAATQVYRFWVSIKRNFVDAVISGSIKVYARVDSPTGH